MSKTLTLSVVIPAEKIKQSLALSLIDFDSHFHSMRYKSLEFLVIDDGSDNSFLESEDFKNMMPSLSKVSEDDLHSSISGEHIILINSESADERVLSKLVEFVRTDTSVAFASHKSEDSVKEKITDFLVEKLDHDLPVRADTYPHSIFMKRETVKHFLNGSFYESLIYLDLSDKKVESVQMDHLEEPGILHNLKVWFHLIYKKIKDYINELKNKIIKKFKNVRK